jgi:hypothetical protein
LIVPDGLVQVPFAVNSCTSIEVDAAIVIDPPPFVTLMPVPAVSVALVSVFPVVLPINNWPFVNEPLPVPPFATGRTPVTSEAARLTLVTSTTSTAFSDPSFFVAMRFHSTREMTISVET